MKKDNRLEKIYKIIKTVLFIVAGVLMLIFAKEFVANQGEHINLYVGIVMAFYGLETAIVMLLKKEVKEQPIKFLNGLINILLAIVMIFLIEENAFELRIGTTIWCIWAIMREGEEIFEKVVVGFKKHPVTSVINFIESVVVIIFSIALITVEPSKLLEYALKHVYLLGVELILEVVWPQLSLLEEKLLTKKTK